MCKQQPPYHTEVYRGFTINIHQDEDGYNLNPYENGDGMYPMMVDGGHRGSDHDYHNASAAFYPTTAQYRRHKKQLLDELEVVPEINDTANDVENAVSEAISQAIKDKNFDLLETVGTILGLPCLHTSSNGYCQGDHIEMLVVWTPEFEKITGVTKKQALADGKKDMEMNAKVFGAWCWNDVYGYQIEGIEDSCWGYIETENHPPEKMYVVQEAREAVDAHIEHQLKKHLNKLKQQIRNHVPLRHRQQYRPHA